MALSKDTMDGSLLLTLLQGLLLVPVVGVSSPWPFLVAALHMASPTSSQKRRVLSWERVFSQVVAR